jgi:hypothetical protein
MIYHEIVHTCSNSYVADAAVISIGGEVAKTLADKANRHAMTRGDYAAKLVREFASHASPGDRHEVAAAAHGSEVPVLSGLLYILERGMGPQTAWMSGSRV